MRGVSVKPLMRVVFFPEVVPCCSFCVFVWGTWLFMVFLMVKLTLYKKFPTKPLSMKRHGLFLEGLGGIKDYHFEDQ